MIRRKFIGLGIAILGIGAMGMISYNFSLVRKIFFKIKDRLNPSSGPNPDAVREDTVMPSEGKSVSVETALNSRCTSDYDDNPWLFHWGMFDNKKKLTTSQVEQIISYAAIPRFASSEIPIKKENNVLTFAIPQKAEGPLRDWLMVESGMQQQAIGLVCAALGAGYVFSTLGIDGQQAPNGLFANVKITVDAMKPSYKGSFWSSSAPSKTQPWKSGTLPEPSRQGTKPLLEVLTGLKINHDIGRKTTPGDISQLLWAARGRTPHYYKSDPWGMTIPTYQGNNAISEVFCINSGNVFKYINWRANSPTHSLEQVGTVDPASAAVLVKNYQDKNWLIVLNKKETTGRALWECGYQLLNLLVQARALEVNYKAVLLDENQTPVFAAIGINDPVALFVL